MSKITFILFTCLISLTHMAQNFDLFLLDDTVQVGVPDPMQPIIFHMEAVNTTINEYHVDVFREGVNIPSGWETALCTEACFPPEVSEAIFFMDEFATDEVSFYFYPSSEGEGNASVRLVNTQDSENYFIYTFYVNTLVSGVENVNKEAFQVVYNSVTKGITLQGENIRNQPCIVYRIDGTVVKEFILSNDFHDIDASQWASGGYILKIGDKLTSKLLIY